MDDILSSGRHSATENDDVKEGPVARAIEKETAKLPSDAFLWGAVASIGVSLMLKMIGRKHDALFVGQWAAPILLFGIYNKIVKVAGSDKQDRDGDAEKAFL